MALAIKTIARLSQRFLWVLFLLCSASSLTAQQPFVTDNADVTPAGHFHFEFSNELDRLQPSLSPITKQNTLDFELDYGLLDGVEIGFEAPWITLFNNRGTGPAHVSGIGDSNLSVKYNFLREKERSKRPALTVSFNFELPTGSTSRQIGSGLADYYLNGVLQKSLSRKTMLRLNGGILFSGNESTGVIGIQTRGMVFTMGGSLVKQFSRRLNLGVEATGAVTRNFDLGKAQLQAQVGGNYALKQNITFDFGFVAGKHAASPRAGIQVGLSFDF